MSKLYSIYKKLKESNKDTVYLFKSGIFYIAISDDASLLSSKFKFKLTLDHIIDLLFMSQREEKL